MQLVLAFALTDVFRMAEMGLPAEPFHYLGLLIGITGCLTLLYWPLYSLVALYAGPKVFRGKAGFRDCLLVLAAAARPTAVAALILIPIEVLVLKPYLSGGMARVLNDHYSAALIFLGINYFLMLWWAALSVLGSKVIHQLSWPKAIIGVLLFPVVFFVINLIRFRALL